MKKLIVLSLVVVCCGAAAYAGNGSHGGSTRVEQSVMVKPDTTVVEVEESVVVEGNPQNVTVVEEVIVGGPATGPCDQPPALWRQKADARQAKRSAIRAAELEHRAYRLGRRANAAALQQRKVVAAEQAYEAAD